MNAQQSEADAAPADADELERNLARERKLETIEHFRRTRAQLDVSLLELEIETGLARTVVTLRPLAEIVAEKREPQWLLHKIIERNVLAVLAGPRGSFKSFVALDWMMRAALEGHGIVILSGEGGGLDRRADAWIRERAPGVDLASLRIVALERPMNLNSYEARAMVVTAVTALPWKPAAILIDTFSKFAAGLDENDNAEVAAFLSGLAIDLRDDLNCTVLLVVHTGHTDAKRPRGASALMCNPDAEYVVNRPDPSGMTVSVTRDRFKDTASLPPLGYTARVVHLGRVDSYGDAVTSLVLDPSEPPASPTSKAHRGRNQEATVAAFVEWTRANQSGHIATAELYSILNRQGIKDRRRRREMIDWLVNQRIVTAAVGGYTVNAEALT